MSNPILSMYNQVEVEIPDEGPPFARVPKRAESLRGLVADRNVDLLILGGGLIGALVAHEAALQGVRVLVLESGYFGAHALSWEHRIWRSLREAPRQLLSARRVFRDLSTVIAPHLVAPLSHDSHRLKGVWSSVVKRWVPLCNVNERLLIRESILAARQEGAAILSATEAQYLEVESSSGCYIVGFKDSLTQQSYEVRVGGILVDPSTGMLPPSRLGSYIIPISEPTVAGCQVTCSVVPADIKGAARFASFELSDGSFVSVSRVAADLVEVTVLFGATALHKDVVSNIAQQACTEAGWRIQSEISSRDIDSRTGSHWDVREQKGILNCHYRGPWDAFRIATIIVRKLVGLLKEPKRCVRLTPRPLPGAEQACELQAFRALARAQGIRERLIELCIDRWHGRVRYIAEFPNGLFELCPNVLRGEVDLAFASDQATSVEDVIFGALTLHQLPGWQDLVKPIADRCEQLASAQ